MKKISIKIILLFVTITLLPLLTLGSFSYKISKQNIENELKKTKLDMLTYTSKIVLKDFFDKIEKHIDTIASEIDFVRMFEDEEYRELVIKQWDNMRHFEENLLFIAYGNINNRIIASPEFIPPPYYNLQIRPWFVQGREQGGKISWTSLPYIESQTLLPIISLTKGIFNDLGEFQGVLALDLSIDTISKMLKALDFETGGSFNLVGEKGNIMVSTEKTNIGMNIFEFDWGKSVFEFDSNSQIIQCGKEKFYLIHVTGSINNWKVMALIPFAELKKQVEPIRRLTAYIGLISFLISSLFGIFYYEKKILEAEDKNPLTNLYGNIKIHSYIRYSLKNKKYINYLIYFDFDNFKSFNDKYGFNKGDRMILEFSSFLKRTYSKNNVFIGHIGGDDFFLGIKHESEKFDFIYSDLKDKIKKFQEEIIYLYNEEDRVNGYIISKNRKGNYEKIPLLTVSIALLQIGLYKNYDLEDISQIIFEIKKSSKESGDKISCASLI